MERVRPDDPQAISPAALVAFELGRFDTAERILRQAAAVGGDVPGFRADLVQFLLERGRVDEAEAEVVELERVDRASVPALLTRGQILLARGRPTEARVLLERAAAQGEPSPLLVQALQVARSWAP
jgi:Flp pilus assembly protein TadD